MDLYHASSQLQIEKNKFYLIQNIERWYRHAQIEEALKHHDVPVRYRVGIVAYIVYRELYRVFCLPVYNTHSIEPTGGFGPLVYDTARTLTDGLLSYYTLGYLHTPKERATSDITFWLRGMDLYMEYRIEDRP